MSRKAIVGDKVEGFVLAPGSYILYQTGQKHRCDAECMAAGHKYKHKVEQRMIFRFTKKRPLMALSNGQVSIPDVGVSDDVRQGDL